MSSPSLSQLAPSLSSPIVPAVGVTPAAAAAGYGIPVAPAAAASSPDAKAAAVIPPLKEVKAKVENFGHMITALLGLIIFLIIFAVAWIVLYTFKPCWVRKCDWDDNNRDGSECSAPADPARCFVAALIIALIFIIVFWLIKACWRR